MVKMGECLQAIDQNGLLFSTNVFDIERYKNIQTIAAEMISKSSATRWMKLLIFLIKKQDMRLQS